MAVTIMKQTILMLLCLFITVSAAIHEPQVYEILNEPLPELVRTARHSDGIQINYFPPVFNFRAANQQDFLKAKYLRQQKIDSNTLRNGKLLQLNPDESFERQRKEPVHIKQFSDAIGQKENDWKPIQPKFLSPVKKQKVFDLDLAASEDYEEKVVKPVDVKSERQDVQMGVIYVQPEILKSNLGLDAKVVQEILKNSAPELTNLKPTNFQINELQGLLGQNPQLQLQGLQKLLGEMPVVERQLPVPGAKSVQIQVQHNGSPALESADPQIQSIQNQLDAVNKARADALLAAAQKQAEAHVQAQHQAIALAQKKAEQEVLAKIAAHNKGIAPLNPGHLAEPLPTPSPIIISSTESPQLYSISSTVASEEVEEEEEEDEVQTQLVQSEKNVNLEQGNPIVTPSPSYDRLYAPSFNDLRENSTRGLYQSLPLTRVEVGSPKFQLLTTLPAYPQESVYAPGQSQRYIPISSTTLAPILHDDIEPHHVSPDSSRQAIVQLTKTNGADTSRSLIDPHLYSGQDVHQYAAKYAFGYRVVDEKTGNDFGHEEERDGHNTKGHYFVLLPDGRRQKVDYFVDGNGYHARVSYDGVSKHPYAASLLAKRSNKS
ncbi:uncharacterized protein LOC143198135 isoform X2 [Rhynchophorus ferrugineus]|uniref:Cuticle protein n=1 Tax=Rhynchophorus ferrugineus TaxID=354439 RepID=A0A834HZ26_RHYFE|nr:hypothetical protein GWI33_017541 [Rhynchophorus ferrugineus]